MTVILTTHARMVATVMMNQMATTVIVLLALLVMTVRQVRFKSYLFFVYVNY